MYEFYINGIMLPVTPGKISIKEKGNNKTVDLINEGEVNIIKPVGLQEVSFEALLPNQKYPFARYPSGFKRAWYYVENLQGLFAAKRPFQFIVTRELPSGTGLTDTNMRVTLEDMDIQEDAKNGTDVTVSLKLKEYREYGTKMIVMNSTQETGVLAASRELDNAPQASGQSYTVQKGDSLWKIAKTLYGNGADYSKIYDANSGSIKSPNLIYPGQVLTIP